MSIGMAVNSGMADDKIKLAKVLEAARLECMGLGLWVDGKPFEHTLAEVARRLRLNAAFGTSLTRNHCWDCEALVSMKEKDCTCRAEGVEKADTPATLPPENR